MCRPRDAKTLLQKEVQLLAYIQPLDLLRLFVWTADNDAVQL